MEIRDLYAQILDLDLPWIVLEVAAKADRVNVRIEFKGDRNIPCPRCGLHHAVHEHTSERTWRHLDTGRIATYLHSRLPTADCPTHGKFHLNPPWGRSDSHFTLAFEELFTRLAEDFGDLRKAAEFLRVEQAQLRSLTRSIAKETGWKQHRPTNARQDHGEASPSSVPAARQSSLFGQNDFSFVNRGIQAFREMELERAVEFLQKHRKTYPKGYDVSPRLEAADFLLRGFQNAPAEPSEKPGYLCRLWDSYEDYVRSRHASRKEFITEAQAAFFSKVIRAVEELGGGLTATLPGGVRPGYILLNAGRLDEAIQSLQGAIAQTPHDPVLFGYLGDAYWLRGDRRVARQCYLEACLIDTARMDWRRLQDEELHELRKELHFIYGPDPELALAWLPSHARVNGLFERKVVRLHDGLKQMIDGYLAMEKAAAPDNAPVAAAKLFFKGLVLCENQEYLKFIKKIDHVRIRETMKRINPLLFGDFLETIVEAERGSRQSRPR